MCRVDNEYSGMIVKVTESILVFVGLIAWKLFVTNYFAGLRDAILSNQFQNSIHMSGYYQAYTILGSETTFGIVFLIGVVIILGIFWSDIKFAIESL